MVNETRLIAFDATINHHTTINDEQKSVVIAIALILVTQVCLAMSNAIAEILNDARTLADATHCKGTPAMNARATQTHQFRASRYRWDDSLSTLGLTWGLTRGALRRGCALFSLANRTHTATGARIAG